MPVSRPHGISGEETEIDRKRLLLDARSGGELDSYVARYEFSAVFVAHGTQQTPNRITLRHIAANSVSARFAEGHKFGKSSSWELCCIAHPACWHLGSRCSFGPSISQLPVVLMDCLACGTSNPAESSQCLNCGAALIEPCASCGAPVPLSNRFCGNCGARSERSQADRADQDWDKLAAPIRLPQHLVRRVLDTRALLEGERKQITVLFADIKGSTNLIEDLDPEEAELRLRPALDAMINAVHRYEGTINRVQGDGIMALFGAPLAHEDNAVRAAYAALDMQKDVRAACDAGYCHQSWPARRRCARSRDP